MATHVTRIQYHDGTEQWVDSSGLDPEANRLKFATMKDASGGIIKTDQGSPRGDPNIAFVTNPYPIDHENVPPEVRAKFSK